MKTKSEVKEQKLLKRIIASQDISFQNGEFRMMSIPGMPFPLPSLLLMQSLLEEKLGEKNAHDFIYSWGKTQSYNACKIMAMKFGIHDKIKLTNSVLGHFPMVGGGIMHVKKVDYEKKEILLLNYRTPFAKVYRAVFGISKKPVDHFIRGLAAGLFEYIFREAVTAIERSCIAQGSNYCLVDVKPTAVWRKNREFQDQIPSKDYNFEELKKALRLKHFFV